MRKLILIMFCFSTSIFYSQDILWEKSLGGKKAEYMFDAIPTPDYGFILAGSSMSGKGGTKEDDVKGNYDYWIWKMDEQGQMEWQKSFGGSGFDYLKSIKLTQDGGYILGGVSDSDKEHDKKDNCKGKFDFWIIKLDAKGNEQWQRTIGGEETEKLNSIITTKDGGYLIGGTSASNLSPLDSLGKKDKYGKDQSNNGNLDLWIVKLKSNGEIEWQKDYGGGYSDELKAISQTSDGGFIVGSYSNSLKSGDKANDNFGEGDFWILKLDNKGNLEWQKTFGGDKDDHLYVLLPLKKGGYIIGGNSNSEVSNNKTKANGKGTDFWILKLDDDGAIVWQETYDFGKLDVLTSIVENPDETLMVGGFAQSEADKGGIGIVPSDKNGINDYIGLKINAKGEELWSKSVGSKGDEVLSKLFETRDGGYVMVGTSSGEASRDKAKAIGEQDFWIVKLKDLSKPKKERTIVEAFPNPALSYTNVVVNFEYEYGTATLYDLAGRLLKTEKMTGNRTIPIDLGNLPSGIYIVNVKTNNKEEAIKVIKK